MAGIQTKMRNERNEEIDLTPNDPQYWEGPYKHQPYPKALYRFSQPGQQQPEYREVKSEDEHAKIGSDWKESPTEAKAHWEKLEADMHREAAASNYADRNLGEKARKERDDHERAAGFDEVIPNVPLPRRAPATTQRVATASGGKVTMTGGQRGGKTAAKNRAVLPPGATQDPATKRRK